MNTKTKTKSRFSIVTVLWAVSTLVCFYAAHDMLTYGSAEGWDLVTLMSLVLTGLFGVVSVGFLLFEVLPPGSDGPLVLELLGGFAILCFAWSVVKGIELFIRGVVALAKRLELWLPAMITTRKDIEDSGFKPAMKMVARQPR